MCVARTYWYEQDVAYLLPYAYEQLSTRTVPVEDLCATKIEGATDKHRYAADGVVIKFVGKSKLKPERNWVGGCGELQRRLKERGVG